MNARILSRAKAPSTKQAAKTTSPKQTRAKPDNWYDGVFLWLAKTGAIPGSLLLLPMLPIAVFLCIGLIYHYEVLGGWISAGLMVTLLIFTYTLRHLSLRENSFRLRRLGYAYLSVCLSLLITTIILELWVFE